MFRQIFIGIILVLALLSLVGCGDTPSATPKATEQPVSLTPLPTVDIQAVTHGRPHFGGPLSDFIGTYGKSTDLDQPYHFPDGQKLIKVYVDDYRGIGESDISNMTIASTAAWSLQDEQAYCTKFIPDEAALEATNSYNGDTHFLYNNASIGYKFALVVAHSGCMFSLPTG